MDYTKEVESRFSLQKEFLGDNKLINKVEPLVSVCVQTYQHESFINDCLNGILMQKTSFPFEIVLGEDDSKDNTRAICIDYAKRHTDKIRLFLRDRAHTQLYDHKGNLVRRLNGIFTRMSARGKYIALCEGDDYWTDPLKLQKQVEFLEENEDYVLTYHDWVELVDGDTRPPKKLFSSTHTLLFRNVDIQLHSIPKVLNGDTVLKFMLSAHGKFAYVENILPAVKRRDSVGVWNSLTETEKVEAKINTFEQMLLYFKNTEYHKYLGNIKKKLINNLYRRASFVKVKSNQNALVFWSSFIKELSQKGLLFHYLIWKTKSLAAKVKKSFLLNNKHCFF